MVTRRRANQDENEDDENEDGDDGVSGRESDVSVRKK